MNSNLLLAITLAAISAGPILLLIATVAPWLSLIPRPKPSRGEVWSISGGDTDPLQALIVDCQFGLVIYRRRYLEWTSDEHSHMPLSQFRVLYGVVG